MTVVALSPMNPGKTGLVVGALLVAAGVRILLALRRQRRARRAAAIAATWHPSKGPRREWDDTTMLLARTCDQLDATQLIPAQREASR